MKMITSLYDFYRIWTAIWDVQDGLIQTWRTRGEFTHRNDQILYGLNSHLAYPVWPDPDPLDKMRVATNMTNKKWF